MELVPLSSQNTASFPFLPKQLGQYNNIDVCA